jgi:putative drug exporter of the RND superfamily
MIFRFRDELREGADVEPALVETMTHAGRSVIVSGSTVAVGLLSLIVLPLPFIRSIGIGGMLIPAVSVLAAITLLPAMLAVLGERINSVRVLPRRFVDRGHPEDGAWAGGRASSTGGRCRSRWPASRSSRHSRRSGRS